MLWCCFLLDGWPYRPLFVFPLVSFMHFEEARDALLPVHSLNLFLHFHCLPIHNSTSRLYFVSTFCKAADKHSRWNWRRTGFDCQNNSIGNMLALVSITRSHLSWAKGLSAEVYDDNPTSVLEISEFQENFSSTRLHGLLLLVASKIIMMVEYRDLLVYAIEWDSPGVSSGSISGHWHVLESVV